MKKIFFLFLFVLILFFLFLPRNFSLAAVSCITTDYCIKKVGEYWVCQRGKCVESRPLEIDYPKIPGVTTPKVVASGPPEYVNYIFRLAVIIIGFVLLGVIVYSGVRYLTSAGDPAKMGDAREGILAGLLGAVILFSAVLIFNTINPQLTILKLPPPELLGAVVTPGIYVCKYEYKPPPGEDNIETILNNYIQKGPAKDLDREKQVEAAKKLRGVMGKSKTEICQRVARSGNFEFDVKKNYTMFNIPTIETIGGNRVPKYEYGIVLHEKDWWRGKCWVYATIDPTGSGFIYTRPKDGTWSEHQFVKLSVGDFEAKSYSVFQKPLTDPPEGATGISLYKCYDHDKTLMCPEDVGITITGGKVDGSPQHFKTDGADFMRYDTEASLQGMAGNARSAWIYPQDSYFAIVFDEEHVKGDCAYIYRISSDITRLPIKGDCPQGCGKRLWQYLWLRVDLSKCTSCIRSMIVIKGKTL